MSSNATLTCEPAICESSSWILGTAGKCNNITGVCDCPPGYTGTYILVSENDCHISTTFRQVWDTMNFSVAVFAFVASIVALTKLIREISRVYKPSIVPVFGSTGREMALSQHQERNKQVLERKLLAVQTIVLFLVHSICEVTRTSVLLHDHEAYAYGLPADVAIITGIGLGASRISFFLYLYVFTTSLPNNAQLAVLLGRHYDAKRYKKLIKWAFKFNGLLCMLIQSTALWLNAVMPTWYTLNFGVILLVVMILIATSLHGLVCLVYYMNVPSFQKIIDFCGEHKSVPKLRTAVFRSKLLLTLAPPGIVFLAIIAVWASFDPRVNFIPFTNVAMNESLLVSMGSYLLAWDFVSIVEGERGEKMSGSTKLNSSLNRGRERKSALQPSKPSKFDYEVSSCLHDGQLSSQRIGHAL